MAGTEEEVTAEGLVEECTGCGEAVLAVYLEDGICPDCRGG